MRVKLGITAGEDQQQSNQPTMQRKFLGGG
jgi:hypothetical protein